MSRAVPLSPKNPQEIIRRYLSGESPKQIGGDFGYTTGDAITKFLKREGVQIRTRAENLELLRSRSAEPSTAQIAVAPAVRPSIPCVRRTLLNLVF